MKNLIVGQSGGPTAVINSSLYGVICEGFNRSEEIEHVYGMVNGIQGFLDGRFMDMKELEPESLMKHCSMVFQDVYLFQDTLKNNIRFGRTDATDEEIVAAAKKACCHEFIMRLPKGYDTMVGEGGCTLSGGEKQRISIARAILKEAPVVLLDEATASLDPENEVEVQQAINTLIAGRTVIVIAHRLKTIRNADRIIVLEEGRIAEQGTHDELLSRPGLYAKLWNIQEQTSGWKL